MRNMFDEKTQQTGKLTFVCKNKIANKSTEAKCSTEATEANVYAEMQLKNEKCENTITAKYTFDIKKPSDVEKQ